ncbi:MAG: DUF1905 domain-containing protein [Bacteroidia bacterium]|nr:DUF1905 domain-containing protein [Bacteroidia bacterium]
MPTPVVIKAMLEKFDNKGEKSGWTYIYIKATIAKKIKNTARSFNVKGSLDAHIFKGKALIPMGGGNFIFPVDAAMRKAIGKVYGAKVDLAIETDESPYLLNADLMQCLIDEPEAFHFFNSLTPSHQRYFSKWIDSAKTLDTKAKRIAMSVTAFLSKQGYPEMLRAQKAKNKMR